MKFLKEQIREFFRREHQLSDELGDECPLFSTAILDSFALVNLLGFLENGFSITVPPADIKLENFDTIDNIATYAGQRQSP